MDAENTAPKQRAEVLAENAFKPGESGNPKGRPKGSRNKLGEAFLSDLLNDWEENGAAAIAMVRADKPDQYLKVVASTLPKELNVKVSELDELTDDQIARQLASVTRQLAAAGFDIGAGTGSTTAPEQTGNIPTLQ